MWRLYYTKHPIMSTDTMKGDRVGRPLPPEPTVRAPLVAESASPGSIPRRIPHTS